MSNRDQLKDEPTAYCACLKVKYNPLEVGEGLMRERWVCEECGREFIKKER